MKLIAIDLDGTLLRSDGAVSERTVETLQRCTDAGMTVVLASARPLRSVRPGRATTRPRRPGGVLQRRRGL